MGRADEASISLATDRPFSFDGDGAWKVVHTHSSVPFYMDGSVKGAVDLKQALIFSDISREAMLSKIVPNLWYTDKAEEAAAFYASLLPNSKVDSVTALPADSPSGPAGSVKVVEFTLMGQPFMAFSAGPLDAFNHSISLMVQCDDQAEIDRLWAALSEGGRIEQCGWLKDRYGLFWQIAPTVLGEMMKDADRERAKRVAEAMLKMIKLDIEGLKKAYEGR